VAVRCRCVFQDVDCLRHDLRGRLAAQSADGIPLQSFGTLGAQAVVTLFAMWGLSQLVFTTLGVLALVRYRAMVPLLYVLLLVEHVTRRLILLLHPIATTGRSSSVYINWLLFPVLLVAGLVLSLWSGAKTASLASAQKN
jgi:cytochrome bd-type quinol oxidase subunit 2